MKTWAQRIDEAEKRDYFTDEDRVLATQWPTCACGEQDERIPRSHMDGSPDDVELEWMGCSFAASVALDHFDRARELMEMIEGRARFILQGLAVPEEEEVPA